MSVLRLLLISPMFIMGRSLIASDLRIAIWPHAGEAIYGDPIYIKVTISNVGTQAVEALPKLYWGGDRLAFTLRDPENDIYLIRPGDGDWAPSRFEPGQSVIFYQCLFLPKLRSADHDFWRSIHVGERIEIAAVYSLGFGVRLVSNELSVPLKRRDNEELELLKEWSRPGKGRAKGPTPTGFGIDFQSHLAAEDTAEVGAQISGELGSMLRFCARLQEIYALPVAARKAKNAEILEWLQKQPDVKRQALTGLARRSVEGNNMSSTAEALQAMLDKWSELDKQSGGADQNSGAPRQR